LLDFDQCLWKLGVEKGIEVVDLSCVMEAGTNCRTSVCFSFY